MVKRICQYGIRIQRKLFSLAVRNMLGTITHVATQDPVVALTFDDGPDPVYTPRLLDILETHWTAPYGCGDLTRSLVF